MATNALIRVLENPLGQLIALLFLAGFFVFIVPVLGEPFSRQAPAIVLPCLIIVAAMTMTKYRRHFIIAALIVTVFEIASETSDFVIIYYSSKFLRNVFLTAIIVMYVLRIARVRKVSVITIMHVLIGYLLMGIVFASMIDFVISLNPGAYTIPGGENYSVSDLNYYTFITLTTVGYGDFTPLSPLAKSLTTAIAICGQFYVAVIIAMIVGKFASRISAKT